MKFGYKFSNLCGTVYKQGNVIFTSDGNTLLSPVGNRISVFDLVNNRSSTLPFENKRNIARIVLSANDVLLLSIDEDGHCLLINFQRRVILHRFNFKAPVHDIQFSPDNRFFAVTHGKTVQVWHTPGLNKEFAPFVLHRTYTGHFDDVLSIDWSADSRFFVTGSRDETARVHSLHSIAGFTPVTLSGHRGAVVGVFFSADGRTVYTVGKDGSLYTWDRIDTDHLGHGDSDKDSDSDAEGEGAADEAAKRKAMRRAVQARYFRVKLRGKYYFEQKSKVQCVTFHKASSLLVAGFTNGVFGLYELPDFNCIHTLSVSQKRITAVAMNATGEWLAFGSQKLGQLLVWEWQAETYVLRQQGHFYDLNTIAYSPDGHYIATGGDDGKLKIWDTSTGFCFVTFKEHTGPITAVEFSQNGMAVWSASLDGTVRAFDMSRYRNFRICTTPSPCQFTSLALDPSGGEVVCAGSLDTFEIYMWSTQTGRLLEVLSGHEGPVSCIAFSPTAPMLASASWDKTVRLWEVYSSRAATETLHHTLDVLQLAWRPDGKELCVSTLDGQLTFWDPREGRQTSSIEGRKDVGGGRGENDRVTAANAAASTAFNSMCYTADGTCVLAGGSSKYVCIYQVEQSVLLKRFTISNNFSLDAMNQFLSSKNMTEAGPLSAIQADDSDSDVEERLDTALPGASRGDKSSRRVKPRVRTKCVRFSPTGRQWAAASTEGLIMFSLDDHFLFDPFDLDLEITPKTIRAACADKEFTKAIMMSLQLNETPIVKEVFEAIPMAHAPLVAANLSLTFLQRLLAFIAGNMDDSPHLEFHLAWVQHLLTRHGRYIKTHTGPFLSTLRALHKQVHRMHERLAPVCDTNAYSLDYVLSVMAMAPADEAVGADAEAVAAKGVAEAAGAADASMAEGELPGFGGDDSEWLG